ncbi:MAG: M3 family oligoendopeptidase [Chloroflexota bacterium]|nr:M3 family oligoendopeptidase [Chloroflexota bacterium]
MNQLDTRDWSTVRAAYEALETEELAHDNVQDWLQRWSNLEAQILEDMGNAASRAHENTADEEAEALHLHYVREILPKVEVASEALKRKLLALEDYEPPADQQTMMRKFHTEQRLFREENVPLKTELNVLANEHRKVTGQMTVEWEGKTLTLDQAEQLLMERDRETREKVWHAIHERWLADRETLNEQYLKMLQLRRQVAENAGFDNYQEYAWLERGRYEYTPEDAYTFHDAIEKEVVPVARRIYEARREALALGTLRPWDLDVPTSEQPPLRPFEDVAELEEGCARIFRTLDSMLGEQFDLLRDGYLDLDARPNKAPGGYCRPLPVSQRSYIFMNAVGNHRNVQTLLHEGGHAFHNQHAYHLPLLWMRRAPTEMAEVASMGMEMLAQPYLEKAQGGFYNEADANRARVEHLEKIVTFLPYMAVVDAFQHWVYTEAPEEVMADDLDAKWAELWDRFMVGIDYEGLEEVKETGWHRKRHIFVYPFYYIEYGLAQVGALQLWHNSLEDPKTTLTAYREALSLGGIRPLPELFKAAGIRFAFDRRTLGELMELVEKKRDELQ